MDCPFCGETVPDTAKVCPECGFVFTDTAPVPASTYRKPEYPQHPRHTREKIPLFIILLIIGGICLTAGGIGAFVMNAGHNTPAAPADIPAVPDITPVPTSAPKPYAAYLTIESNPPGAVVSVGGNEKGITPLTIEILPGSKYAVFIEMDGYETVFESVTLENSEHRTLSVVFDENNLLPERPLVITGTWQSINEVPDQDYTYYTLFYKFSSDGTGKEYWYQNGRTINICPFVWSGEGTHYHLVYAGGEKTEEFTLSRDGKYLNDEYGYSYKHTNDIPSITLESGAKPAVVPENEYTRTFTWRACGYNWQYTISFPKTRYQYYSSQPRYMGNFLHYTSEQYNRLLAKQIADDLLSHTAEGFSRDEMMRTAIAFVQSIPYVTDLESTGHEEYYKYPIETLYDGCGDCEDTSILMAAILKEMGYDVVLVRFNDHMGIAVNTGRVMSGAYYEWDGKEYYYIETTTEGAGPGDIPDELLIKKVKILYVE